jgi:hypothetical protein
MGHVTFVQDGVDAKPWPEPGEARLAVSSQTFAGKG